jgi:hypothetical protein
LDGRSLKLRLPQHSVNEDGKRVTPVVDAVLKKKMMEAFV